MIRIPEVVMNGNVTYHDVELRFGRYHNGCIALALGPEDDPLGVATVNLIGSPPAEGCVWIKDWSENEGVLVSLVMAGVIARTGRTATTGYVIAHEAQLLVGEDD